jgi:hypothetical protein
MWDIQQIVPVNDMGVGRAHYALRQATPTAMLSAIDTTPLHRYTTIEQRQRFSGDH